MKKTTGEKYLQAAFKLPQANHGHFRDQRDIPHGVEAKYIRISNDSSLRTRLIDAGYAEGLQSPIGREVIKSIIRIYPDGNAPSRSKKGTVAAKALPVRKIATTPIDRMKNAKRLPTIEDLKAIVTRVEAIEAHLARELTMTMEGEINRLKSLVGSSTMNDIEPLTEELRVAIDKKKNARQHIRVDAIKQVHSDREFPQREFLALVAV